MKREGLLPAHGLLRVGSVSYDKEVVLLLHDWYHRTAKETVNWFESIRSLGKEVCTVLQYNSRYKFVMLTVRNSLFQIMSSLTACSHLTANDPFAKLFAINQKAQDRDCAWMRIKSIDCG
jgi:hypothetical protein